MSLAIVYSRASDGIHAPLVTVEVHLSKGLPGFSIVGLPETAVKESRHRVRSAIINSGLEFPVKRITVNLAPADLPKEGGRFDLAIALGILAAAEQIPKIPLESYEFAGELALSGELRPIRGALPFAIATADAGRDLIITAANQEEAKLCARIKVFAAKNLLEVYAHLRSANLLMESAVIRIKKNTVYPDLCDVVAQDQGKRALEIAAAGGHSLLFLGPPGTGKTMLATRLTSILPDVTEAEALEIAAINSISREGFNPARWGERPFRAPHHTSSSVALVGGGSPPQPGEITLAHHGILFLDELPQFNRHVLDALREPSESGTITISRATYQSQFPARFQLIAAMNPCPCGYFGDSQGRCRCTQDQVNRYQQKISGPFLDRIDLQIEIGALPRSFFHMQTTVVAENSETVRQRVCAARDRQLKRSQYLNVNLENKDIYLHCHLRENEKNFLEKAMNKLSLSGRAFHRILKVARTIADLAKSENIEQPHLAEALSYRKLDRNLGEGIG